ncbi:hypothetical protein DM02DRAFT_603082 [Periconia macrospinosa]|uniref:Large ribosomal subunit protein eL14 domain-containing protein n=1 Tax=Periconia macrospinosa TaxID=97972 RepID=A0A2V1D7Q3_9PLEO|nr:hypothetical protein DM02DRAFT_603082 [Periconia macrospinosa]
MDLTPVRIRGKKRKPGKSAFPNPSSAHTVPDLQQSQAKRQRTSKAAKYIKRARSRKGTASAMPTLQGLPVELLEMIFLHSMNISLPRASPALGRKLSSPTVSMEFVMRSFFHTVDHRTHYRDRKVTSDPAIQSDLLACKFFTWKFFLTYVEKAHSTLIKQRGKIWEDAGVEVPGPTYFTNLWPFKFTKVTYLSFAEGFKIPQKLLHGPWNKDKASLLYVLVSLGGEIDWEGSVAGELAKEGIKDAIRDVNEHAVAALSVLLGVRQAIDTAMLRFAVRDCGCTINIIRHLLFNAQILHSSDSDGALNFYDPSLWQWAESHEGKGVLLKDMLKRADKFSLGFYLEGETDWANIVPFPYSGPRFDVRSALDNVARELLTRLYRNYGRRITSNRTRIRETQGMGDAEISTSAWRYVEVGRVVRFNGGEYDGRLAAIVEIIDHKRILVDGPSEKGPVPRHAAALAHVSLTPIVIPQLPRACGVGIVKKKWEKAEVDSKFEQSTWAKKSAQFQKRRQLNDFERFKVLKLRKQARHEVRRSLAKVRSSA